MSDTTSSQPQPIPEMIESVIRRSVGRSWDENHLTYSWLDALADNYGNRVLSFGSGHVIFDCLKLSGSLEKNHGDIGFLVKLSAPTGKSLTGFASLEAKRSYPDQPANKYAMLDPVQLERQAENCTAHRLLLYSHTPFYFLGEQAIHTNVLPACLGVLNAGNTAALESSRYLLGRQVIDYLQGWDLDFSPARVTRVLAGDDRFSYLLRAHTGLSREVTLSLRSVDLRPGLYGGLDGPRQDFRQMPPAPKPRPPGYSIGGRGL